MAGNEGFARWLACGFGSGLVPVAPGTFGSLVGVAIGLAVLWAGGGMGGLLAGVAIATLTGIWAVERVADGADHGWIVIDEIAGQMLAMLPLAGLAPAAWPVWAAAAFGLFRLFDITKPGPVGWADRQHGAWGIMGDDLLAGIGAAFVLAAVRWAAGDWGWIA